MRTLCIEKISNIDLFFFIDCLVRARWSDEGCQWHLILQRRWTRLLIYRSCICSFPRFWRLFHCRIQKLIRCGIPLFKRLRNTFLELAKMTFASLSVFLLPSCFAWLVGQIANDTLHALIFPNQVAVVTRTVIFLLSNGFSILCTII